MTEPLPSRPNLDHLRRQAKSLLAALDAGDATAIATFQEHLPAAKKLKPAQIRSAGFRLADAQSAIARKSGFAAWPQLSRHVEQLRALEGAWAFDRLEIDGAQVPANALGASRLLIDGDRFRMESPEATYEGVFNIDVEADPQRIDIEFVEGPEAGHWNYGIFRCAGDQFELCLDMRGKGRPSAFRTAPGSGHACETLRRVSTTRPTAVTGGTRDAAAKPPAPSVPIADVDGFAFVASPTLAKLEGQWTALKVVRDGQTLPTAMIGTGRRVAHRNEVVITFGGKPIIQARVRLNEAASPIEIDYLSVAPGTAGAIQLGIMEWRGEDAWFCMAAPGQDRPTTFESPNGSGRTLSGWRRIGA